MSPVFPIQRAFYFLLMFCLQPVLVFLRTVPRKRCWSRASTTYRCPVSPRVVLKNPGLYSTTNLLHPQKHIIICFQPHASRCIQWMMHHVYHVILCQGSILHVVTMVPFSQGFLVCSVSFTQPLPIGQNWMLVATLNQELTFQWKTFLKWKWAIIVTFI